MNNIKGYFRVKVLENIYCGIWAYKDDTGAVVGRREPSDNYPPGLLIVELDKGGTAFLTEGEVKRLHF